MTNSKHLWLELKPAYIDANFEQVFDYLQEFRHESEKQNDTFYLTTLELLRQRATELVQEEAEQPFDACENPDKVLDLSYVKLLCLYLINEPDKKLPVFKEAFFTLINILIRCENDSDIVDKLVEMSLKVLSCESVESTGVSWEDFNPFHPDIISHKIINKCTLVDEKERFVHLEGKGTLRANMGVVKLSPTNRKTMVEKEAEMVASLSFFAGNLQVLGNKSGKIKQGEAEDIEKIKEFTNDFIDKQSKVKHETRRLQYDEGDIFYVKLVSKEAGLKVRSVDPKYEVIEGRLVVTEPSKMLFYNIEDFKKYLEIGDVFSVTLKSCSDPESVKFSLDEEFKDCITNVDFSGEEPVLAKLMSEKKDKRGQRKLTWWTEDGFPAYSDINEDTEIEIGQYCVIELTGTGEGEYRYYVNAEFKRVAEESEVYKDDESFEEYTKRCAVQYFTKEYEKYGKTDEVDNDLSLDKNLARQFCRLLFFYQRSVRNAVLRYRLLCTCRILSRLTEDEDAAQYLEIVASYLENVVAFANDEYDSIKSLEQHENDDEGIRKRIDIVNILMEYGKNDETDTLDNYIDNSEDELLVKLAKLVQSANRISHVVSDNLLAHIKKEIISNLSIDTADKTDLEVKKGTFYGTEDSTKEFKTSFFEGPTGSQMAQNLVIFKELCAFLNSELGGTLYLGVGESGYAEGLERDMQDLSNIGLKAYAGNLDGYKRYILDDAKKHFTDNAILTSLTFIPLENGKCLAIKVEPWMTGIVEMDDKAYLRVDSEALEMNAQMKDEIVRKKLLSRKNDSSNVRNLMSAIAERKKVILHGYASNRRKDDRNDMEPFAFDDDYQTIWCYEPASDSCKSYKVARIASTEILEQKWEHADKHKKGETDIFRMGGPTETSVKLQLDNFAKLLLCEEFPKAIGLLVEDKKNDSWYLETKVRSFNGIGRFYLGLGKKHITIIDSPEFEAFVKEYIDTNL